MTRIHRRVRARWGVCLLLVWACGCGAEPSAPPPSTGEGARAVSADGHGHAHVAPHGGVLAELGDHVAQLELVVDASEGRLTLYVLDGEAERAVRIAQPAITVLLTVGTASVTVEARAVASVLTGERAGDASEFAAQADILRGAPRVDARVETLTVRGQSIDNIRLRWLAPGVS